MAVLTYQVLICNEDKFALSNGHLYYHQANLLPKTAVLVSEAIVSASAIYAITKLESERLGWTLPTAVVFVSFRQIITNCSQQTANSQKPCSYCVFVPTTYFVAAAALPRCRIP